MRRRPARRRNDRCCAQVCQLIQLDSFLPRFAAWPPASPFASKTRHLRAKAQAPGRRDDNAVCAHRGRRGPFEVELMNTREPILHTVPIDDLRPTQMTVGYREVKQKREEWRDRSDKHASEYLGRHMVPAVLGPKDRYYLVDHHHLTMALCEEKQKDVLVTVIATLTSLSRASFWTYMDNRALCHPYDAIWQAEGLRRHPQTRRRPRRRPLPQPGRRAAPRRRLRQGHHALQRVPLGRLPALAGAAKADRRPVHLGAGAGDEAGAFERGQPPSRLVRAGPRLAVGPGGSCRKRLGRRRCHSRKAPSAS